VGVELHAPANDPISQRMQDLAGVTTYSRASQSVPWELNPLKTDSKETAPTGVRRL